MRLACILALGGVLLAGCAQTRPGGNTSGGYTVNPAPAPAPAAPAPPENDAPAELIVTPGGPVTGKIVSVNPGARFVVLSFPLGSLPALDRRLNVYRNGLKVGELKVTGPQRDNHTVADIVAGESQAGDEVRED